MNKEQKKLEREILIIQANIIDCEVKIDERNEDIERIEAERTKYESKLEELKEKRG